MAKPTNILKYCLGLNTKDHPSALDGEDKAYLAKAVNVNITDTGDVEVREGSSSLVSGYTDAHSLFGFLNRYAVYADGGDLFSYDVVSGEATVIKDDLTPDIPLSFTMVGDHLAFTNGIEKGLISLGSLGVQCDAYFSFVKDLSQSDREIVEFPTVDIHHFYKGSMYGAVLDEKFIYCSEPYKPTHYDQVKGYISLTGGVKWVKSVEAGLLVGTDAGIVGFQGSGLVDFQERIVLLSPSPACSEYSLVNMGEQDVKGVFAMTGKGVIFITDQFEITDMTANMRLNWGSISGGMFGLINNSYIFSGVVG